MIGIAIKMASRFFALLKPTLQQALAEETNLSTAIIMPFLSVVLYYIGIQYY